MHANQPTNQPTNQRFMRDAILEAENGIKKGHGGPFGAVIVKENKIIGRGHNKVFKENNPTLHGEMVAITDACKNLKTFDLQGCDIYTTGEPCPMCLCALMWANIENIYYGCTIKDNEIIGFRDDKLNSILNIDRKKITNLHELDRNACLALFDKYNNTKDKRNY
ncbi:MAG: nucleoside deaminase [Christensenellaceae bacterium]|jgi:tRNA(Arg) A34 adenosine deaminase TadA|nr:nucleoside deaminase [Christensenellaceae bacterium]